MMDSIRHEKDNNAEWIAGPEQEPNVLLGINSAEWMLLTEAVEHLSAILDARLLIEIPNGPSGEGLNVRAVLEKPISLQLATIKTGELDTSIWMESGTTITWNSAKQSIQVLLKSMWGFLLPKTADNLHDKEGI
jgi:hypothetical protein